MNLTLCLVSRGDEILLGMKKRGFGAGLWNGFGGKVESNETIEEGALREVEEEIDIKPRGVTKAGELEFSFDKGESEILKVYVFKISDYEGEPIETDEMRPQWFSVTEIPFEKMWSDDKYWIPYFLEDKLFSGKFHFDQPATPERQAKILFQEIQEVDNLL